MNKLKPILSARKDCTISYTIVILAFAAFHQLMTELMPDWGQRKQLLNSRAWVDVGET